MELQRGICSLCSESSKVFPSPAAEELIEHLPRILYESSLPESKFHQIKASIKICFICSYKLELCNEAKKLMTKKTENHEDSVVLKNSCHFCKSTKCIMKVKDDWKFFIQRTEDFLKRTDFPVNICCRCMFYFDTIFNFKIKLLRKFPQLAVLKKSQKSYQQQIDTPKRKSLSNSPQNNSKKRKIFDNCFTYLQPLCNNNYNIDVMLKKDAKMYRKIAYVNLSDTEEMKMETPKVRPKIKIKLKKTKKLEREKIQQKSKDELSHDNNIVSQPYVKLCKSEEIFNNVRRNNKKRYSLSVDKSQANAEENINETPKTASLSNLAPKRRVSLYVNLNDIDNETEVESENKSEVNSEEICNIVQKYIKDTTFNDTNKLELLQEIEESKDESKDEDNVKESKDKNNVEESRDKNNVEESKYRNEEETKDRNEEDTKDRNEEETKDRNEEESKNENEVESKNKNDVEENMDKNEEGSKNKNEEEESKDENDVEENNGKKVSIEKRMDKNDIEENKDNKGIEISKDSEEENKKQNDIEESKKQNDIEESKDKNNIEETVTESKVEEKNEDFVNLKIELSNNAKEVNETNTEVLHYEEVTSANDISDTPSSKESLKKSTLKCTSGDLDVSDNSKDKSNVEKDSCASERKKKRVTFSDEINE